VVKSMPKIIKIDSCASKVLQAKGETFFETQRNCRYIRKRFPRMDNREQTIYSAVVWL